MIQTIIQLLITGVAMGLIYGLVGIEFTLLCNAADLVNFAHDKFIMLGAYVFSILALWLGVPFWIAFIPSLFIMGIIGAAIAGAIFNPLRHMPGHLYAVAGTLALSQVLLESVRLVVGPVPINLPGFLDGFIEIGDYTLSSAYLAIIPFAVLIIVFNEFLMKKTKLGRAMRAVAKDKMAASLMGIDVSRNIAITIIYTTIICGLIGILIAPLFSVWVSMADMIGLKGFSAAIIGGFGSVYGCILGGLLIGVFENLFILFGPGAWKDIVAFILMILILVIKPVGLLGKKQRFSV